MVPKIKIHMMSYNIQCFISVPYFCGMHTVLVNFTVNILYILLLTTDYDN